MSATQKPPWEDLKAFMKGHAAEGVDGEPFISAAGDKHPAPTKRAINMNELTKHYENGRS